MSGRTRVVVCRFRPMLSGNPSSRALMHCKQNLVQIKGLHSIYKIHDQAQGQVFHRGGGD